MVLFLFFGFFYSFNGQKLVKKNTKIKPTSSLSTNAAFHFENNKYHLAVFSIIWEVNILSSNGKNKLSNYTVYGLSTVHLSLDKERTLLMNFYHKQKVNTDKILNKKTLHFYFFIVTIFHERYASIYTLIHFKLNSKSLSNTVYIFYETD